MRGGRRAKRIRTTSLMVGETDLNCLIRTSSTSLETTLNHSYEQNGCYGHLSARTSSSHDDLQRHDDELKAMRNLEKSSSQNLNILNNHLVIKQDDHLGDEILTSKQPSVSSTEVSDEEETNGKTRIFPSPFLRKKTFFAHFLLFS